MAKSKLVKANEKIAKSVTGGLQKIQDVVIGGYIKIKNKFVEQYLTHDGKSVADAKSD